MTIFRYNEKLNNKTFAIGMSKKVPDGSANLAYVSSPEITQENISIVRRSENVSGKVLDENYFICYANDEMLLETTDGISTLPTDSILVTDEFTIKKYPNSEPQPLFYVATLKYRIKGKTLSRDIIKNSIPYVYGYELRTIDQLKYDIISNDKSDITPLESILTIKTAAGSDVTDNFKVRLTLDQSEHEGAYLVTIYNSFDKDVTYKVNYIDYDGISRTEVLKSNLLFNRTAIEDDIENASPMDKVYKVIENEAGYQIYAPTEIYKITDKNREAFAFKYRVLSNINAKYNMDNTKQVKIGMIYLNNNISDDIHGFASSLVSQINQTIPGYISFINPHPPLSYWGSPEKYFGSNEYWDIDLSLPQHYINDYDIIFFAGYGQHDLSAYNKTLGEYLMQGGKIVIDNASNNALGVLDINFGLKDPIIDYGYEYDIGGAPIVVNGSKLFIDEAGYKKRCYDLSHYNPNRIAYFDSNSMQVGAKINISSDNWTDIIHYGSGEKSIGFKNYNNRGKIYLSNAGILKAFTINPNEETRKFISNLIVTTVEDLWISTPWEHDRVYHMDQLFDKELGYANYISDITTSGNIVAKKIIASTIKEVAARYIDSTLYRFEGQYHVDALEYIGNQWVTLKNVYLPPLLSESDALYAYAINPGTFSTEDLQGYSASDISVYGEKVEFKFTIRPFTYDWERDNNGNIVHTKIYGSGKNITTITKTISKNEGIKDIGLLATILPEIPGADIYKIEDGVRWSNRNNVFFEIKIGYYENGSFNDSENRVNLAIYDKATGEYIYASDGTNVISYNDLFKTREVVTSSGTVVSRKRSEDIVIQAFTSYYIVTANKRTFAIKNTESNEVDIHIPKNLNTEENWHPRIKKLNFAKTAFGKEDYDRWIDTLGFKFEKDYILGRIKEYFGGKPGDKITEVVAKLNGNNILDRRDLEIISEAFDVIESNAIYKYDMVEYHKQAWNPLEPIKRSRNELVKFIDDHVIQLQFNKLHIDGDLIDNVIKREKLDRVSPTKYKSINIGWLIDKTIAIEVQDPMAEGGWRTIGPYDEFGDSNYAIDYDRGLVTLTSPEEEIYASYSYSNIIIERKQYVNNYVNMERLVPLDSNYYDISHENILGFEDLGDGNYKLPKVHFVDSINKTITVANPTEYDIDYIRGFLKLNHSTTSDVYMSYSYSKVDYLTIKDYDPNRGLIELNEYITFNDNIYATYYYEDEYLEYKGYRDGSRFIYLDLNPTPGHTCTTSSMENGELTLKEIPTYEMLDKTVYIYMLPSKVIKDSSVVYENDVTIRHTFDKEDLKTLQLTHPELIVLGNIKISNDYTRYDVQILDTRKRGGGLKETITESEIKNLDQLSLNFWDLSALEGRKYFSNGIIIVKVPNKVKETLTESEIEEIIYKHLSLGVYPIIKYYDEKE